MVLVHGSSAGEYFLHCVAVHDLHVSSVVDKKVHVKFACDDFVYLSDHSVFSLKFLQI